MTNSPPRVFFLLLFWSLCVQRTTYCFSVKTTTSTAPSSNTRPPTYDHVVVMGIGDLRTTDHGGLALADIDNMAVAIVLTDETIRQCPHARSHTKNTVRLLHQALETVWTQLSVQNRKDVYFCTDLATELPMARESYHVWEGLLDMDYTAVSALMKEETGIASTKLLCWSAALRKNNDDDTILDRYPDYYQLFVKNCPADAPYDCSATAPNRQKTTDDAVMTTVIPTEAQLLERFVQVLDLSAEDVEACADSGLYGTHWSDASLPMTLEDGVLGKTKADGRNKKNPYSLEHASMEWQLQDSWWLPNEDKVRLTAAPLWLGTLSPRQVWHTGFPELVEGREWHCQLATQQLKKQKRQKETALCYGYWWYQGFLCRYLTSTPSDTETTKSDDTGMLLVHGFGASGSQWTKCMQQLLTTSNVAAMAPDLLGFGHSQKPAVSYTSYLWESNLADFIRDVVPYRQIVVGGNSIGGYCAMGCAANDDDTMKAAKTFTANGAPGTGRCRGLVLMNTAGIILRPDEIDATITTTLAQRTADGSLPPCQPPARPLVRLLGNTLLSLLRPNIQSICAKVYPVHPEAVDDELCGNIERDSLDPGAIHVMMAGTKLPPPRTSNELLVKDDDKEGEASVFTGPVLVTQGLLDPLNDAPDRLNRLSELRDGITPCPINAGHCPHDEAPAEVAAGIVSWMASYSWVGPPTGKVATTVGTSDRIM